MQFFKTDYRGIVQLVRDWEELRHTLRLGYEPHYSILCHAHRQLLRSAGFEAMLRNKATSLGAKLWVCPIYGHWRPQL